MRIKELIYKGKKAKLPKTWTRAAGMLTRHKRALESHAKNIRKEWGAVPSFLR